MRADERVDLIPGAGVGLKSAVGLELVVACVGRSAFGVLVGRCFGFGAVDAELLEATVGNELSSVLISTYAN